MRNIKFKDFITLQRGFDLPKHNRDEGNYPVIAATGIHGSHSEFKVHPPGVVTGRSGSLGEVVLVERPYWPLNTTLWVKDFKGNIPRYVYYYLKTLDLKRYNSGAGVPTLNRNHLDSLPVKIHDSQDQNKISAILSAYDDLIENNLRRIKILEEMAQNLYREWFVKFRFPGHQKVKMVDSPLGKIPGGWEVLKVRQVANIYRGKSYRSQDLQDEGGLPFVNLKCVDRGGGFRIDGLKNFRGDYKESHIVKHDDIVIAITDMTQERRIVAHAARIPDLGKGKAVFSMDLVKLEPKDMYPHEYIYAMLRYSHFSDEVKLHANGVNVLHLSPDRIMDFKFPLAPKHLREKCADILSKTFQLSDLLERRNVYLRQTRDLLLPKLIPGDLDVSELDITIPEAKA